MLVAFLIVSRTVGPSQASSTAAWACGVDIASVHFAPSVRSPSRCRVDRKAAGDRRPSSLPPYDWKSRALPSRELIYHLIDIGWLGVRLEAHKCMGSGTERPEYRDGAVVSPAPVGGAGQTENVVARDREMEHARCDEIARRRNVGSVKRQLQATPMRLPPSASAACQACVRRRVERRGFDRGALSARTVGHEVATSRYPTRYRAPERRGVAHVKEPDGARLPSGKAKGPIGKVLGQRVTIAPVVSVEVV